jgi:actin related protein 2/3 complex subunit 3
MHRRQADLRLVSYYLLFTPTSIHPLLDYLRQYLIQVRQELSARLVEKLYADGTGKPSKWWMSFQKRRFMNRSLGT